MRGIALLLTALLGACGQEPRPQTALPQEWEAGARVDTVGVLNLAEGDTLNTESGLTLIETTRKFPPQAANGEVFAWEFYAQILRPVKLIIVRFVEGREKLELVGESQMMIPEQLGVNRVYLREPIPVGVGYMFGVLQPEEAAIPFKKIRNWKTLITMRPLQRPLMRRDQFTMYGWRYAARVFWRPSSVESL